MFQQSNYDGAAAYYDLLRYENELRRAKNLNEAQRLKLWEQRSVMTVAEYFLVLKKRLLSDRLRFQELDEARRRARYWQMTAQQRQLLGLAYVRSFVTCPYWIC